MKNAKNITITFILCSLIFILIFMSGEAKLGAKEGLTLCENIIIPSLLPILIITNIIIKTDCSNIFEKLFGALFEKVLRLPRCSSTAVIFGLIGGYPAGAVLTSHLYEQGYIDEKNAARIMRFNFCGGVAFIITAVGTICNQSTKTGAALYIINIISSLIICIISALFSKKHIYLKSEPQKKLNLSDALVESVEITVKSLLNMCAYIILFSALTGIANLPQYMNPLIEITNGICSKNVKLPFEYCAFFLAFGGFCIHFQLIGILRQIRMKYIDFLVFRVLGALISFAAAKIYLILFPDSISVFSNLSSSSPQLFQVNTGLSLVMIIGCAVLIFDIENKKLKNKQD